MTEIKISGKQALVGLIVLLAVGLLTLLLVVSIHPKVGDSNLTGAFSAPGFNNFMTPTITATTTGAHQRPVMLMTTNTSRIYGLIVNDSDTDLYIFMRGYKDTVNAGSVISSLTTGIRINANGGSYEILPENLYNGPIWASSTAASKQILVIEK